MSSGGSIGSSSGAVGAVSGKNRRLAAERAAIRQRLRDDLARQQKEFKRQKEITDKTRLWNEILPFWDQVARSVKVVELCQKGIPPNIRGKVWPLLVGNELNITEERFESLNKEIHVLFQDNVMTASSRRTEKIFESSWDALSAQRDENDDGERDSDAFSRKIPIPSHDRHHTHVQLTSSSRSASRTHSGAEDVTEEAWFENERQGSLDQEAFGAIQRQLFGQCAFLAEREREKERERDKEMESDRVSPDLPIPRTRTPLDAPSQSLAGTPLSVDNTETESETPPFAMSPPRNILSDSHAERDAFGTPDRKRETDKDKDHKDRPRPLLVPGVTSPSQLTPPHRTRHRHHYLKEAGLVREKEGTAVKSRRSKTSVSTLSPEQLQKVMKAVTLIQWDLPRTFPTLAFFHDGGAMHTGLERVLLCFAVFRPDIGYVQGMSFLVATLLLYMDEFEAFKSLSNLLANRLYSDFYGFNKPAIDAYVLCFNHYFKKFLPLLFNHMAEEGVTSEMFLMDWNLSIFTKALPLEVAAHVWDVFLLEGEIFLLCVGLGILKMYAPILSTYSVEQISPFLLHLPEDIRSDELFMYISQINISRKGYEKIRKETRRRCEEEESARLSRQSNGNASHVRRNSLSNSLRNALRGSSSAKSPSEHSVSVGRGVGSPSEEESSRGCRQS